jgi:hypothetical protein
MKKFIFLTILFATMSLSTKMYATCSVGSSSAYCTLTSYSGNTNDTILFYITPYTDVYFTSTVQSLGNPGGAGFVAYTDTPTPGMYPCGPSGVDWSDGLYGSYGISSSYYNVHWQTGGNGWIDMDVTTQDGGYAYISSTW